ncbi:peptidoglycan-recognition protein SC2-like [Eupeodes corollae]|uniref:peptidoglycan-recognition protein SC2-like n=1 Tax=Eupeodes corollae TaxID=290404 RepID=UPI002493C9B0|nr:peptidoglycan-recognition protein SC2-like [Eupeodes corollae]
MVNIRSLIISIVLCGLLQGILAVNIIKKAEWGGLTAVAKNALENNLQYVVIHHSAGAYCNTTEKCKEQMRNMQSYHMNTLGWDDIGYNFGIGADGNIYEGRGFGIQGAHASSWNGKSIGIMFIGNYNDHTPTDSQILKANELLTEAVSQGHLSSNYTLYGHRQVGSTECPGNKLFKEIQKWSHWWERV